MRVALGVAVMDGVAVGDKVKACDAVPPGEAPWVGVDSALGEDDELAVSVEDKEGCWLTVKGCDDDGDSVCEGETA